MNSPTEKKRAVSVRSIMELSNHAVYDPAYQVAAIGSARSLGGRPSSWQDAIRLLRTCAEKSSEKEVVQEVNNCIQTAIQRL